jgi:hypothetical protein
MRRSTTLTQPQESEMSNGIFSMGECDRLQSFHGGSLDPYGYGPSELCVSALSALNVQILLTSHFKLYSAIIFPGRSRIAEQLISFF